MPQPMRAIFTIAIFLSAFLLFALQPMVGKLVLPKLGGSPAVWNTCMVFFQALLLIGYGYAHLLTRKLPFGTQIVIHAVLLLGAAISLPIALPSLLPQRIDLSSLPSGDTLSIIIWLITILIFTAAAPFLILSATAPLLQSWFSKTTDPRAHDPYFLYAASNAGSVAGLLSYPTLIEPNLGVDLQGKAWSIAYGLLVICLLAAAISGIKSIKEAVGLPATPSDPASNLPGPTRTAAPNAQAPVISVSQTPTAAPKTVLTRNDRLRWIVLAAVPSSLSLGVTQYISTDIAAVPLIWVVPLLIYLISFIFAFSKRGINTQLWGRILAISCCVIAYPLMSGAKSPTFLIICLHLLVLLSATFVCHGRLARERPSTENLTEYYFLMSLGGMLGGLINGLIAPILLPIVFEYQLAIAAAVLLRPQPQFRTRTAPAVLASTSASTPRNPEATAPVHSKPDEGETTFEKPSGFMIDLSSLIGLVCVLFLSTFVVNKFHPTAFWVNQTILFGIPCIALALLLFRGNRWRFALGLLIVLAYMPFRTYTGVEHVIYTERTFFGVYRVYTYRDHSFHTLFHGTTTHGVQPRYLLPEVVPATYYHRTGPIGQVFTQNPDDPRLKNVAAIGLGTGSVAAYNQVGRTMRFYEIDQAVVAISVNKDFFTYLPSAKGTVEIVLGDGRLEIAKAPDHSYGLIILDAFSSDAIPTHLLTREALAIYRSKLQPGGILAIHISNVYFDLEPVVAALAADCGMIGRIRNDEATGADREKEAKSSSTWCVLADKESDLGGIAKDGRWLTLKRQPTDPVWTDNYSNILKVMNWK